MNSINGTDKNFNNEGKSLKLKKFYNSKPLEKSHQDLDYLLQQNDNLASGIQAHNVKYTLHDSFLEIYFSINYIKQFSWEGKIKKCNDHPLCRAKK